MVRASQTGGVKPMSIAGRYINERERLLGMTDAERAFRAQWLKDQELSPNEPRKVPEMYKDTHNIFRRFYRWPLNQFEKALTPIMGGESAHLTRVLTGKGLMAIVGVYWITYYMKYNANDWTRAYGWKVKKSRKAVVEGDIGYPQLSDRTKPSDYMDRGFSKNTLKL